jgi:uncharacterized protein YkwD
MQDLGHARRVALQRRQRRQMSISRPAFCGNSRRLPILIVVVAATIVGAPLAHADRKLNSTVVADVFTIKSQAGCTTPLKVNPQLLLAAQWHAVDVLNNRDLDADIGSDGSTVQDRARNAGYLGNVAETVAINPALSISGIELINQWYYNPAYMAIMSNCANTQIGVWSENSLDRTVVVAVYGQPTSPSP